MIKAVIFDLDGTLLNRDESLNIFIDKRGYVWKDKVYQELVAEFEITGLTWEDLLQDYISQFQNSCVAFPSLISMLGELKNSKLLLGIITNGKGQFQMDNIRALGIERYFDIILISEWERMKKPEPQIFKKALEEIDVLPNESIFIGDHPENDVMAARSVGMIGVWKKDYQWKNVNADFIVEDLREVPSIVKRLN